jgi:hypothetical protein
MKCLLFTFFILFFFSGVLHAMEITPVTEVTLPHDFPASWKMVRQTSCEEHKGKLMLRSLYVRHRPFLNDFVVIVLLNGEKFAQVEGSALGQTPISVARAYLRNFSDDNWLRYEIRDLGDLKQAKKAALREAEVTEEEYDRCPK